MKYQVVNSFGDGPRAVMNGIRVGDGVLGGLMPAVIGTTNRLLKKCCATSTPTIRTATTRREGEGRGGERQAETPPLRTELPYAACTTRPDVAAVGTGPMM